MSRQKMVWSLVLGLAAMVAFATASVQAAGIVDTNLLLHLDAADADGAGGAGHQGSGAAWVNKGSLGSGYDATVAVSGNGTAAWAGNGTTSDPYSLQVRPGSYIYDGGYAQVGSSLTSGNAMDLTVYTYEVWAKINGNGSDVSGGLHTNGGTLMGHNTATAGQGNGSIGYAVTADSQSLGFQANTLYTQSGVGVGPAVYETPFPNSTALVGAGYHQVVLARAGAGATDTAWYLDGVLKGTFQTESNTSVDSWFMIGGRHWNTTSGPHYDMFANADIAIARVYGSALTGDEVLQNFTADAGRFVTPEPSMFALVATGAFGLLAYAWRKRK
jgi:hypothetical protein